MTAVGVTPDIRPGDIVKVFGGSGARRYTGALRTNVIVQVVAVGNDPSYPGWLHLSGRLCRKDLTVRRGVPYTALLVAGPERSITNLAGMWRLLERPEETRD